MVSGQWAMASQQEPFESSTSPHRLTMLLPFLICTSFAQELEESNDLNRLFTQTAFIAEPPPSLYSFSPGYLAPVSCPPVAPSPFTCPPAPDHLATLPPERDNLFPPTRVLKMEEMEERITQVFPDLGDFSNPWQCKLS